MNFVVCIEYDNCVIPITCHTNRFAAYKAMARGFAYVDVRKVAARMNENPKGAPLEIIVLIYNSDGTFYDREERKAVQEKDGKIYVKDDE